jgi:hypothetical protein
MNLYKLFRKFQQIPKGILIDRPNELIVTGFVPSEHIRQLLGLKIVEIYFTRRTLKHVAEKGIEGDRLFRLLQGILICPHAIYLSSKLSRYIFVSVSRHEKEGEFDAVVLEVAGSDAIVITLFVAKQKYLKNFKILWRTAASSI